MINLLSKAKCISNQRKNIGLFMQLRSSGVSCFGEIEKFCNLDCAIKELIKAAVEGRKYAYVPYSKFKVGAAFQVKSGNIFNGCNIENVAFSPTCCAERTAIFKAVSTGCTELKAGAVVADMEKDFTLPCGMCRQVIVEFVKQDIPMYFAKDDDNGVKDDDPILCTSIYKLLPGAFVKFKS